MGRENDVRVVGTVIREMTAATGHDQATYLVEVLEQSGAHLSQGYRHVYARDAVARTSLKMSTCGVVPREGDKVALLASPVPNNHVCVMLAIVEHANTGRTTR